MAGKRLVLRSAALGHPLAPQRHPFRVADAEPCRPGHRLLTTRQHVYETAKLRRPERWSGQTRGWNAILVVHLNPVKTSQENVNKLEENSAPRKAAGVSD